MRVLLSTYGSRGDVEPMLGLAVRLRELGAQVRVCAPPDFAERLAETGVPTVSAGPSAREAMMGPKAWRPEELPWRAAELVTAQFDVLAAAAEGCDALMATGLIPVVAAARAVAEERGIGYAHASFFPGMLPSPHHPPFLWPGRSRPPEEADNRTLWAMNARNMNELFGPAVNTHRASIGLPPVDDIRGHLFTDRPWLAADPVLGPWQEPAELGVVQTGAWILPDERPLPAELEAFLDADAPPVYVGFGSMPMGASEDLAGVVVEAVRAQGRRVLLHRGWADLAPHDERDDCFVVGEVNQQALFARVAAVVHHGGAGTTTVAARAAAPQVLVPQMADQPYWAARVASLGIGAAHDGPTPTFETLSAALGAALAPETRARATAVAGEVRTDGAAVAAKLLLDSLPGQPPMSA